jgi:hypothetical protein
MRRGAELTERDRDLVAYLGVARYLSTAQLGQLVFEGVTLHRVRRRLRVLSPDGRAGPGRGGRGDGERASNPQALIRPIEVRSFDGGSATAWALTDYGYAIASARLGVPLEPPGKDVGVDYVEHSLVLNQLFVDLVRSGPTQARRDQRSKATFGLYSDNLRLVAWAGAERARLPWQTVNAERVRENRLIEADAILTVTAARRRVFIENEMGTHPIESSNAARRGATLAKVESYERYFNALADPPDRKTFYEKAFPDGFAPELLILVHSAARRDNVLKAIAGAKQKRPDWRITVSCALAETAVAGLGKAIYGAAFRPAGAATPGASAPVRRAPAPGQGLVLTDTDLTVLSKFYNEATNTLKEVRDRVRELKKLDPTVQLAVPAYPAQSDAMRALIVRLQG